MTMESDACSSVERASEARTDNNELHRHQDSEEMKEDFESWPAIAFEQLIIPWRQNECVPCRYSESADHEVLVCTQMRRKVEIGRQLNISHRCVR